MEETSTLVQNSRAKPRARSSDSAAASLCDVLDLVRLGQAETRQEIEKASEYGRAIVSDRLATLSALGLIDESETGAATGGRAPRLVRFCKDRARLGVVTLDQSAIGVGIADLSGQLITEHHEAADLALPAQAVDRICTLIKWIISRQPGQPDLWGISISVPGPVLADPSTRFLSRTPEFLAGWQGSMLVETLLAQFQAPVWINSSVETMTMGELSGGAGQGEASMLFVKIGKRIGAGLISNGYPYRGASGAVGLIGQLPVTSGDKTGSLDALAGLDMIEAQGAIAASSGRSPALADCVARGGTITANDVTQAAQMGDAASTEIITRSGRLIGGVVATLANMLNPQLIILAGSVAQTNDILLAAVRETVYGASHPLVTRDLRILRSQMGGSAALLGAASIAVEALFTKANMRDWITLGTPTQSPAFLATLPRLTDTQSPPLAAPPQPPA